VLQWIRRSVARQAGLIAAGSLASAALCVWLLGRYALAPTFPLVEFVVTVLCVVPATGLFAAWVTQRLVGSRLAHLVEVIDGAGPHDDLARIRDLGADEVGAIAQAVNELLARITSIRASMIDQKIELNEAQRELELKASLAEKTDELASRLNERAMLFDVLRMTASSTELSDVLNTLVERVGQLLRFRETVLFLYDDSHEAFSVQATYGFARKDPLQGRALKLGEGISGKVGQTRVPVVIDDVAAEESFLGFWGEAERTGALAAVPIVYREQLLGVLTVTRPEGDPITEVNVRLLGAIADNAALAIRNAQLFERMRELQTHDELTGLANRKLLHSHLVREIDRARRFDKPFGLLAIEIDALEESLGAARSEVLLRDVAHVLHANLRKLDTVARVQGEQFMVLLPRSDLRDSTQTAEKLRRAVLGHPLFADEGSFAKLNLSIGIAQLSQSDDDQGQSLTSRAEQTLASAKLAGRNRTAGAEPSSSRDSAQLS
jgi:diguanylate cyclase (GGDEF)-like protein